MPGIYQTCIREMEIGRWLVTTPSNWLSLLLMECFRDMHNTMYGYRMSIAVIRMLHVCLCVCNHEWATGQFSSRSISSLDHDKSFPNCLEHISLYTRIYPTHIHTRKWCSHIFAANLTSSKGWSWTRNGIRYHVSSTNTLVQDEWVSVSGESLRVLTTFLPTSICTLHSIQFHLGLHRNYCDSECRSTANPF